MSTQDDINRLVNKPPPDNRLDDAKTPDAIRTQTGLEREQTGTAKSKQVTVKSTDGLFTFTVMVVKA